MTGPFDEYVPPPDEPPGGLYDEPDDDATSWAPVNLADTVTGLLSGTLTRPAPSVARFDSVRALFYRGRVNGVAGESGSGKTWTALASSAQELAAGECVLYVDCEDDAAGIVSRLLDMGADPGAIRDRFIYVHPSERFDAVAARILRELVATRRPTLAVIDSTGEALSLDGARPNEDDEVARWFRRLPRMLARLDYDGEPGPAVVVLDHVTKTDDSGLWPIGTQRKRAAVSGAQYMQRTVRPFAQGHAGAAVLVCAKDRGGTYTTGTKVAELTVEPDGPHLTVELVAVETGATTTGTFRPTVLMEKISRALEMAPEPLTWRGIQQRVTGKTDAVTLARDVLVHEGYVRLTTGARNATLHTLTRPFRAADDAGEQSSADDGPSECVTAPRLRDGERGAVTPPLPGSSRGAVGSGASLDYLDELRTSPGRCSSCGWHVATQGHATGCEASR